MAGPVVINSVHARAKWRDLLDAVGKQEFVVERNGKPVAAVIAYEDFVALAEQLDELKAARRAAEIYGEWLEDASRARPYSEIREELVAEGLLGGGHGETLDRPARTAG